MIRAIALVAVDVEFTNGDEPDVRLKASMTILSDTKRGVSDPIKDKLILQKRFAHLT